MQNGGVSAVCAKETGASAVFMAQHTQMQYRLLGLDKDDECQTPDVIALADGGCLAARRTRQKGRVIKRPLYALANRKWWSAAVAFGSASSRLRIMGARGPKREANRCCETVMLFDTPNERG